jgi:hypothetical protein
MFLAALWSRCRLALQSGQVCQRTDKPFAMITPQSEHTWLVNAGSTACTDLPAFAALKVTVQADPECSIGMRMTAEGQLHLECR